jgi:IMP dehydrogenase
MSSTLRSDAIPEYLTFDDVLLKPAASAVLPGDVSVRTNLTRDIELALPILSAAMDTVTEGNMAIAMAQAGGIGVIHRNMDPELQAAEVRQVKKFESGMVVNPITISPEATLGDLKEIKAKHRISGIPVVDAGGKLVGIVTNRDVRFEEDLNRKVGDLMTRKLVTVKEGVDQSEARKLLHEHRIEKLIVVDDDFKCTGLITVTDMDKAALAPQFAVKDEQGRLRVAAATGTGEGNYARAEMLIDAEVDLVVVDTAHGHSNFVLEQVRRIKKLSNKVQVIAGNVATADATRALIDAGADAIKVGIGPGSICTTRIVAGVGVPQLTAIMDCADGASASGVPVIADGGIKYSGDLAKALAAVRRAPWLATCWPAPMKAPVRSISIRAVPTSRTAAWGRWCAMARGSADRYFQAEVRDQLKLVPEGIEGQVPYTRTGRCRAAPACRRLACRHGLHRLCNVEASARAF